LQGDLMAIKKSDFACVYLWNISQYDSGGPIGLLFFSRTNGPKNIFLLLSYHH
jgi:hypothetical protein